MGIRKTITCKAKHESVTLTQWETTDGVVVAKSSRMNIIINDSIHDAQFRCLGYNSVGNVVGEYVRFKIIVNGK